MVYALSTVVRLFDCTGISAGSFDLLLHRADRNSIFRHLLRYKVEHRQRMSQRATANIPIYSATKGTKNALSLLAKHDYNGYSDDKISDRYHKTT